MSKPLVGIVMGSDSDLPVMQETAKILKNFEVGYELIVASAHRTPYRALGFAEKAEENGLEVIIAGAGAAAHLPGVLAAVTSLPVIGVPINATPLQGLDSLYAIVQMPSGIPVATVAINGAKNAGLLAVQILSVKYPELREKFKKYKEKLAKEVEVKAEKVKKAVIE
ncbi:MAG: 5-(carboxyamino)imidazole ribonucleotide mutase [Clostridia bacterium]|nr:5-(carboxyamino)imidazole ribonucleotide mutase [Clostridia bacterium]MDN5322814.1 5-(carboxyamino)imidazole ribonucleotide mutase [Clostridia bacterium]